MRSLVFRIVFVLAVLLASAACRRGAGTSDKAVSAPTVSAPTATVSAVARALEPAPAAKKRSMADRQAPGKPEPDYNGITHFKDK